MKNEEVISRMKEIFAKCNNGEPLKLRQVFNKETGEFEYDDDNFEQCLGYVILELQKLLCKKPERGDVAIFLHNTSSNKNTVIAGYFSQKELWKELFGGD